MRLTSIVLVLALTCIPAQSQDPVKQLRGAKEPESKATAPELPDANSKETGTAAELPANAPANVPAAPNPPANPDDIGVPEKEAETQTVESPASEQGETADPAEASDIGVPTKEIPAKQDGKGHADVHGTRVPAEEDAEEPLEGEGEVDEAMRGPEPMEFEWVPYTYAMEGPPQPWEGDEGSEGDWDDEAQELDATPESSEPDARSFVAWRGGRRWGHRGWGGRWGHRGWGRGWGRSFVAWRGGRRWGHRGWGRGRGRGWGHRGGRTTDDHPMDVLPIP